MEVIVEEKQQSLAIGKKGQNVRLASKLIGWQIDVKSEEQKKQEVLSVMESLSSSTTSLSELEGIGERIIGKLREAGIETVESILELEEDKLREIPGVGEKTAAKIMEAAQDLFEEVEIEVPEGMEIPTAIQGPVFEWPDEKPEEVPAEAEEAVPDEKEEVSEEPKVAEEPPVTESGEPPEGTESADEVAPTEDDQDTIETKEEPAQ